MICWLQLTSGRGPEECCWVVWQLTEYLLKLAKKMDFEATVLETIAGDKPHTFKSSLISFEGDERLSGLVADWQGSVQWIGKSMFRPAHKRRNWFVSVQALIPYTCEEWREDNSIKVERMRASGPGGQHVNKTETAIRLTHLPSGLSVVAQEERSQSMNMKLAMVRLQKLVEQKGEEGRAAFDQEKWEKHNNIERGNAVHVFEGGGFRLRH